MADGGQSDGKGGPLSKASADLMRALLGPVASELGTLFRDQVASWAAANCDRLIRKWRRKIEERGVSEAAIKHLPFGDALRVLRAISEEDDEDVQELWAKLLAAVADPRSGASIKRVYIEVLRSIGPVEARILRLGWLRYTTGDQEVGALRSKEVGDFFRKELATFTPEVRATAVQNLLRQQCLVRILDEYYLEKIDNLDEMADALQRLLRHVSGDLDNAYLGKMRENPSDNWVPEMAFRLSPLGVELMQLCEGKT